jgi:hypothetical protein
MVGPMDRGPEMKRSRRYFVVEFLLVFCFSFLAGCATFPPPKEAIPSSRTYGNQYTDVWEAVLAFLSEQNIQVKSMEKESGRIVAEDRNIELRQFELGRYDSRYCFCGSPNRYHVLRGLVGEYTISVIRGTGFRATVRIDASYGASQYTDERFSEWLPCASKGVFEPFFLEQVEFRLGATKGPSRNLDWWKPSRGY